MEVVRERPAGNEAGRKVVERKRYLTGRRTQRAQWAVARSHRVGGTALAIFGVLAFVQELCRDVLEN